MEVGETVSQGLSSQMIIATVADLSSMQIKLLVDETDIGEVSKGETVTFTVDAYPNREFHGTVRDISKKNIPVPPHRLRPPVPPHLLPALWCIIQYMWISTVMNWMDFIRI